MARMATASANTKSFMALSHKCYEFIAERRVMRPPKPKILRRMLAVFASTNPKKLAPMVIRASVPRIYVLYPDKNVIPLILTSLGFRAQ